jgi:hypothetical protein
MNYIIGAFKAPCDVFITFADERSRKQVGEGRGGAGVVLGG